MMDEKVKQAIRQHALEELPYECCGLLVSNEKGDAQVFKCKNGSKLNRKEHFSISPEEYLVATSIGRVSAMYHSHPTSYQEAQFSQFDEQASQSHNIKSVLYDIKSNTFLEHEPK